MAIWSRLKSLAGGHGVLRTLASAATLVIPDDDNAFFVSGSATVTSITIPSYLRNRELTFFGAASANVTFTNTDSPTVAGTMSLNGVNRQLTGAGMLKLFCDNDGTLRLMNLI